MSKLIHRICEEIPLTGDLKTDLRDVWPKRWKEAEECLLSLQQTNQAIAQRVLGEREKSNAQKRAEEAEELSKQLAQAVTVYTRELQYNGMPEDLMTPLLVGFQYRIQSNIEAQIFKDALEAEEEGMDDE